jgi:putative FmdB family regulatory protein
VPTYEYECTRCGRITEEFKPVSAPRRQRCPHCRGRVERLISGGLGVHFKGSGFYVTDSRSGQPAAEKSAPDKSAAARSGDGASGAATSESGGGPET